MKRTYGQYATIYNFTILVYNCKADSELPALPLLLYSVMFENRDGWRPWLCLHTVLKSACVTHPPPPPQTFKGRITRITNLRV